MKNSYFIGVFVFFVSCFLLCGCMENAQNYVNGQTTKFTQLINGEEVETDGDTIQGIAESVEDTVTNADMVYDEKSGTYVSKTQNAANTFVDNFKLYGLYIAAVSLALGLFLRAVVKNSAAVRKFALMVLIILIPVLYIFFAYVLSYWADRIS